MVCLSETKDIIVLGAGASKSEAPSKGLLQNELLKSYFIRWFSIVQNKGRYPDIDDKAFNRFFRLVKFMKSFFSIDLSPYVEKGKDTQEIDRIPFPIFEEILGLLDISLREKTFFKSYGSLHSISDYDLQTEEHVQVFGRYIDTRSHKEEEHEESLVQTRNDFVFAITDVLETNLKRPLGNHTSLVQRLKINDTIHNTALLSLNYDILMDNALTTAGYRPNYGFEYSGIKGASVNLFKLHGSLNWVYCPRCVKIKYAHTSKLAVKIATEYVRCKICRQEVVPVIVAPTFLKDITNPYLSQVWLAANQKLRNTQRIIFCGYSFPAADLQVKHLLKRIQINRDDDCPKLEIHVVNGKKQTNETKDNWLERTKEERKRFEVFFGNNVVEYHNLDFKKFAEKGIPTKGHKSP